MKFQDSLTCSRVFLSTPSARRATYQSYHAHLHKLISIHALREEGDQPHRLCAGTGGISIHALREEGDPLWWIAMTPGSDFYPRPPRGGRPATIGWLNWVCYFYPRPPRGGRRLWPTLRSTFEPISIHALREEGDKAVQTKVNNRIKFLSTPSARRATPGAHHRAPEGGHFYPRPPRGGRLKYPPRQVNLKQFLSTPSARRATQDFDW